MSELSNKRRDFKAETQKSYECEIVETPDKGVVIKFRFNTEQDAKDYADKCKYLKDKAAPCPIKNSKGTFTVIIVKERFEKMYGESKLNELMNEQNNKSQPTPRAPHV